MTRPTTWVHLGIHNPLVSAILLLQVLSLVSLVQCYRGDISHGQLSPQLRRGSVGVSALVAPERGQFSPPTLSQRRKKRDTRFWEGIALKVEGSSVTVTAAECKVEGLEICGDKCVKQCCNAGKGLSSPPNSSCMANGELEYWCEKGKSCPVPVNCLNLHDYRCVNNPGQLITDPSDDGKPKACCYTGYEICTTIGKFPICIPLDEILPSTPTHTHMILDTVQARAEDAPVPVNTSHSDTTRNTGGDSYSDVSGGVGALVGGLVGGAIGLVIVGICVSCTARYYRQILEGKEADLDGWEDDDSGVMGVRGGSGSSSASGPSSAGSWERWVDGRPSTLRTSSWSKSTLSDTPTSPEKGTEIAVMELENMSSPRGRFYTTDSEMGPKMPMLAVPPDTAASRGLSQAQDKPFDWRSCQPLYPLFASAAPQVQEGPSNWKSYLPWLPNLIPTNSPILGPWSESRRSTIAFDHRMSQRLSFRLDVPPLPPKLEGASMSGALNSSSDDQYLQLLSIQKPPSALLAPPMPMI